MGYDVNYNALDYAQSAQICQQVYGQLQSVETQLLRASVRAQECQREAQTQCWVNGIGNRGYSLGILADKLRTGYHHAAEAVIGARRLEEKVHAAIENYVRAETRIENSILVSAKWQILLDAWNSTRNNDSRPPTTDMETLLKLFVLLSSPRDRFGFARPQPLMMHETTEKLADFISTWGPLRSKELHLGDAQPVEQVEIDGTLNGYYQLHKILNDAGPSDDGQILIAEAEQDGENVYLVILPGTQGEGNGNNPFDTYGIIDAFSLESENFAGPISEALHITGAREGDEVILSGYSQGGIHIANLMKNRFLRKKFKMEKMLTLGSPIGHIDLPEDIRSLSIEDSKDMVPGTDGVENKRKKDQITVKFDGPRFEEQLDEGLFGKPHDLDNYGDHLEELVENPIPDLHENLREFGLPPGPLRFRKFKIERKERPRNTKHENWEEEKYGSAR
ncbi:hypothetical protein CQ010_06570 [Arthrobacter sp. MYb211]|uniref:hypothetical protein n=1 Tax=unclassified Arthrobacter TaxID=235627 RepID=UPI000CFC2EF6|nr:MULTISPECIES: hypothetical protein [unclassified Arthrobacter]PRA12309.1 hypothetical protein CQ015_07265 [Arthrobacter sp. MYb221]PRC08772.1 hypothetical protein CQ010_06570 [Arthrobacter sp. MYb211]